MRLIDADAFIEYLGLNAENAREDNVGEIVTLEDFDRQPTAFDKENVIDKLEKLRIGYFLTIANTGDEKLDCAYEHVGNALDKVLEIVEKGGIEFLH